MRVALVEHLPAFAVQLTFRRHPLPSWSAYIIFSGPRRENFMKRKIFKNNLKRKPIISVVLPVYNSKPYLEDCLESIFAQTFKDFEVIAVDDASTDGSYGILLKYAKRFKNMQVFRNNENKGVSETAKKAIAHSRGDYLARMDADDICAPDRLEKQLKFLRKNKKTVAVGGQCLIIDENNNVIGKKTFPTDFESIYKYIFEFIAVQQPTLMIARNKLPKNFVYYVDGMNTAEEVELFFKLFLYGQVENLPDIVLMYRRHSNNTSMNNIKKTFMLTLIARIKAIYRYNYKPTTRGIIITFLQALLVMSLPKGVILLIYRILRDGSPSGNFPIFARKKLTAYSPLLNYK